MKKEILRVLEELINEELKIADIYRFPINKENISDVKNYFAKKSFKFYIEASHPTTLDDLAKKYAVIFEKIGEQNA